MTADTSPALPPIDHSAREIRVLDFSGTFFPRFRDSSISCSMATVSLSEAPPEYTIISRIPSPDEELVECLVVDGEPVRIPAGIVSAFETLSDQGTFLSMSFPVYLWIEDVCVDHERVEEMEYFRSITFDIHKNAAGLICHLGAGDQDLRNFLRIAQLIFQHIYRSGPGTRDLASFKSIFTFLRRQNRSERSLPKTLAEYSELTSHFFKHPYWSRIRSLHEYLSVKGVGLIYEDVFLWDCNLQEVGMIILQQEEGILPRETIPPSGLVRGSTRDAVLGGLRCWRRLVQWELVKSFLKLHAEGVEPLAWHYLVQLAPQIRGEHDPGDEDAYLQLLSSMLQHKHPWSEPPKAVDQGIQGQDRASQGATRWLSNINELCASKATAPCLWRSGTLDDLLSASQTHLSNSPLFFLTHAGIGFHEQPDDVPSWMPNYDTISRSPARVPLTFEDLKTYTGLNYQRCNPAIEQDSLVVHGMKIGELAEVQDIPEPKHILDLFAFLHTVPVYEITSDPHREGTRELVKQTLLALYEDPHSPPSRAALHCCVGTLLIASESESTTSRLLFRLLDLDRDDDITVIVDRIQEKFLPKVGKSVTDAYGWEETSRAGAAFLAQERIKEVRRYYKLGRVEGGAWGLVPGGAKAGDDVFSAEGYGAMVVLRNGERGHLFVGACGLGVGEFETSKAGWKRIEIR